jgi:hypothetical protein
MPVVANLDGMQLMMYANDHPPPHFHVISAEYRAVFDVRTARLIRGQLPKARARAVANAESP